MRMKKKFVIGLGIAIVIVLACVINFWPKENEDDGYNIAAEALNVEFDADIIVYGEDTEFRDTVKYRTINEITEEELNYEEEHGYRAIVLFDYKGTMNITDEELLLIKTYVEEKGDDMFYIGQNYLDDFKRLGFTVGCPEGAYSLEYLGSFNLGKQIQQNEFGNLYAEHGLWSEDDENSPTRGDEEIQFRIITLMYDYARKAAGIQF